MSAVAAGEPQSEQPAPVLLLGALFEEMSAFGDVSDDATGEDVRGIPAATGAYHSRPVVLTRTGVGTIYVSMIVTLVFERYRPRAVFFSGIAGALDPELCPGDMVVGERTVQHDPAS